MATVAPSRTVTSLSDPPSRVRHPLQRLRSYIRWYVSLEGLAAAVLYLALWFWIGLLVDYGFFKAFGVDWVQELPYGFRLSLLCGLIGALLALVAFKILMRTFREFRDPALALILERRFPDILGDRLITAVELADPAKARRYGYSQSLIDNTIREGAERVERLPISEVLDWGRLVKRGIAVLLLTVGVYLLLAAVYCLIARRSLGNFAVRSYNLAAIWFERNVLLRDSIWPRRCHLELIGFPVSGDLRVGRNAPPPTLRVRAWKWVLADPATREGWRPIYWADLTPDLLDQDVPEAIPAEWRSWTLDRIEQELETPTNSPALNPEQSQKLQDLFNRLAELAESPWWARRLRRLEVPPSVEVAYRGETIRSEQRLSGQGNNEFSGALTDLRESVYFTVRAADYTTAPRSITIVPPPGLISLTRDRYLPAYLFHRLPADASAQDLRGKKQVFRDEPVSLSGSASRLDLPTGTRLVLHARTDKPLLPDGARLLGKTDGSVTLTQTDAFSFEVVFPSVTVPLDLTLEFTDTDGVVGQRSVVIRPLDDLPPDVDVVVDPVVRKISQGYLITPLARIPFSGKVRDDHGLDAVEYVFAVQQANAMTQPAAAVLLSQLGLLPSSLADQGLVLARLAWAVRTARSLSDERPAERQPVSAFVRRLRETADDITLAQLLQRLEEPPRSTLLNDFVFDPGESFFEVEGLRLKVSDERQVQPHYRLRLGIVATDNNLETGPGVGQTRERFSFLVVAENELLVEIAREEEGLHLKLEDTLNRLKDARGKLEGVIQELPRLKPDEFSPMTRRTEEVAETVVRSWDTVREVHTDYRRILREMEVNRVQSGIINRVRNTICDPLQAAIDREFVDSDEKLREFLKALEARQAEVMSAEAARTELNRLIERLSRVLDAMGDVTTINKLIATLVEIQKSQQSEAERLRALREEVQARILEEALIPLEKPEEKKP